MAAGPIVVTGATGLQGGATARHLLRNGRSVHALVRDPGSPRARILQDLGATLVRGDMSDIASLRAAFAQAVGVFSVQPTAGYPGTPADFSVGDEVALGVAVAEAATAAGVQHLVYASVGGAERDSGIRRWQSKWQIEQRIAELGIPATILRPVRFMENQFHPELGIRDGVLTDVFQPQVPVQLIASTDIGAFAALAFAHPDEYVGQALELAGDELTMPQIVQAITAATGQPVAYHAIARDALGGADPDALAGYIFANEREGWRADIAALRSVYPALLTFETWLSARYPARTDRDSRPTAERSGTSESRA
ncbi:Uncharacterized conserved protein YbjT, contains NAD(P)-binding and DUF2867 domains [Microlunatus soli]|uniref:Uncharacterized conserved protein YbjT, contains NAD(P)-binding and DUF2867 domains n=1 Tax=Microlunatus soli TaxID=630515 RepID=A0A1H1QRW6_9ACTN|nr:Uncharacterized conserved protein YbjT, contains NAD(P)-binding and DUF2867 domains [Microlunatus soli]